MTKEQEPPRAARILHVRGHLVVADPDPVVCDREIDDMIDEGLALRVALWRHEDLGQELLGNLPVGLLVEGLQDQAVNWTDGLRLDLAYSWAIYSAS